jgi:hypothetical protein
MNSAATCFWNFFSCKASMNCLLTPTAAPFCVSSPQSPARCGQDAVHRKPQRKEARAECATSRGRS